MRFLTLLCLICLTEIPSSAQTDRSELSPKLKALQENYDAAVARAKDPITKTYINELEKLKAEYTRSSDLKSAVATDELIKVAQESLSGAGPKGTKTLADMNERQFRKWLSNVVITEIASPQGIQYTLENDVINTMWADLKTPRIHQTATIEVGRLIVPFTNTVTTITIDNGLTKAKVAYSSGKTYEADISEKKRR
jgi:hypothetical protein